MFTLASLIQLSCRENNINFPTTKHDMAPRGAGHGLDVAAISVASSASEVFVTHSSINHCFSFPSILFIFRRCRSSSCFF